MKLTRTREIAVNLGNNTYESARIGATVELDTEQVTDKMLAAHKVVNVIDLADALLSEALAEEVKYWHEITQKKDSAIHLVHQDNVAAERIED